MEKKEDFTKELETQYAILIKAEEKRTKKRVIAIFIIITLTLIVSLITCIFSLQSFLSTDKEQTEEIDTEYYTLSTVYNTTSKLSLSKIGNGYSLSTPKVIKVTNEGTTTITYNITLSSIVTSLVSTNNLVYTLTKNNEVVATNSLPLTDTTIVSSETIEPNATNYYTIKVSYVGTMETNDYTNYYTANLNIQSDTSKINLLN